MNTEIIDVENFKVGNTYYNGLESRTVSAVAHRQIHWVGQDGKRSVCSVRCFQKWLNSVRVPIFDLERTRLYESVERERSIERLESLLPRLSDEAARRARWTIENLRNQQ